MGLDPEKHFAPAIKAGGDVGIGMAGGLVGTAEFRQISQHGLGIPILVRKDTPIRLPAPPQKLLRGLQHGHFGTPCAAIIGFATDASAGAASTNCCCCAASAA